MALKKLDVIVRRNSTVTQDYAIRFAKHFANNRQENDEKHEYYIDLFDSRTKKSWKVFSDLAAEKYDIQNYYTTESGERIPGVITLNPTDMTMDMLFSSEIYKVDENKCIEYNKIAGDFISIKEPIKYKLEDKCVRILENIDKVTIFYKRKSL